MTKPQGGYSLSTEGRPGAMLWPCWFEPPYPLVDHPELWIAAVGAPTCGRAQVLVSEDDDDYELAGSLVRGVTMGHLLDPIPACDARGYDDAEFRVRLHGPNRQLPAVPVDDCLARRSLAWVGTEPQAELIAWSMTRLLEASDEGSTYLVSGLTVRGAYGTRSEAWGCREHPVGSPFVRYTRRVFRHSFPSRMVGRTLYVKLPGENTFGENTQPARLAATLDIPLLGRFYARDPRRLW